ncbi:hypothetical protein POM88_043709 [Heracleum sosnowskyi]|uniref:Uncharacterized protein n=1 Tax=Heracleum sosnowskyi TaxID=360622 RepID=A0AAD8M291_9APIA|nr:hypothetical protein POM88_043709 [Heracleum sosnowskyi]
MYSKSVLDSDEFFSAVTSKFNEARDEIQWPVGGSHFIWCSSWCKIPFYEADFGWGKPSWISRFIEDDLVVSCNDEGVKYVEAVVDLCLEDIIEGRLGLELLDCLVPNDDGADHSNSSNLLQSVEPIWCKAKQSSLSPIK